MAERKNIYRHWFLLVAVSLAGMAFLGWDDSSRTFEIYLKRSLVADGEMISLKSLAHSFSGKPYALDLESIYFPVTQGRLLVLGTRTVREMVAPHYQGQLILVGRGTIVIPRSLADKAGAAFFERTGEYLLDTINEPLARIEMECSLIPDAAFVEGKNILFDLAYAAVRSGVPLGAAVLRFRDTSRPDHTSGEMSVVLHIYAPAAFPKAPIKSGQRFDERDVKDRDVDLAVFSEQLLSTGRMTGAYTASQTLYPDRPIPLKKVARALFVRSGDKVNLTFVKKNITIGLRGRALGSGSLDDRVSVKPDGATRRFEGLVTGDKEVLIELR
jgi:flagella basal body P-ring formation protein FlgA